MKNGFELTELKLVASTQTGFESELIELRLVTLTQMKNESELDKLESSVPTQMTVKMLLQIFFSRVY